MQSKLIKRIFNNTHHFKIGVLLSTLSLALGILREFLIVGLLGFSAKNDNLQLYLSIFYTIGLSIDAMRLACLNLYSSLTLTRILCVASLMSLPFTILIGSIMSYATGGLNFTLLICTLIGSYLNLIAAVLITYKQRNDVFLLAQMINIMPNFLLIPGILACYWFAKTNIIFAVVLLTSLIPLVQCSLLLLLPNRDATRTQHNSVTFLESISIFTRHFFAILGDQMFQVIARSSFYNFGTGYLSILAIAIRVYAAARFILVDSFIGSRLAKWETLHTEDNHHLVKLVNLTSLSLSLACISFAMSMFGSDNLLYTTIQMSFIFLTGFYFSTLVRIVYFKINRSEINTHLVMRFAVYELICAFLALILARQLTSPILAILWLGYIAKPFAQLLLLRKSYQGLAFS